MEATQWALRSDKLCSLLEYAALILQLAKSADPLEKDLRIVVLFLLASTGNHQAHGISVKQRVGVGLAWAALAFPVRFFD